MLIAQDRNKSLRLCGFRPPCVCVYRSPELRHARARDGGCKGVGETAQIFCRTAMPSSGFGHGHCMEAEQPTLRDDRSTLTSDPFILPITATEMACESWQANLLPPMLAQDVLEVPSAFCCGLAENIVSCAVWRVLDVGRASACEYLRQLHRATSIH